MENREIMDNDFQELVAKRCEKALIECKEYMDKEYSGDVPADELQYIAEEMCYKKGFSDAVAFLKCS